jgi:hypothetical protein
VTLGPRGGVGWAEGWSEAASHGEEPVEDGGGRLTASTIFGAQ